MAVIVSKTTGEGAGEGACPSPEKNIILIITTYYIIITTYYF